MKKLLFLSSLKELLNKTTVWQRIRLLIAFGALILICLLAVQIMSLNEDLDYLYGENKSLKAQILRLEDKVKDFDARLQQMDDKNRAQLNWWLSPK